MKRQVTLIVVASAAIVLSPAVASEAAEAQTVQQRQPIPAEPSETIDVRYAKALVGLAKLELLKAVEANQKTSGSFSDEAIDTLRQSLGNAELQLAESIRKARADTQNAHVRKCEESVRAADAEWRRAIAANRKTPGSVSENELERLRLTAEVARLGLIKARAANAQSALEHLQWQLEELRSEVLSLRNRVEGLSQRN